MIFHSYVNVYQRVLVPLFVCTSWCFCQKEIPRLCKIARQLMDGEVLPDPVERAPKGQWGQFNGNFRILKWRYVSTI